MAPVESDLDPADLAVDLGRIAGEVRARKVVRPDPEVARLDLLGAGGRHPQGHGSAVDLLQGRRHLLTSRPRLPVEARKTTRA
jgi:hypothetical protein